MHVLDDADARKTALDAIENGGNMLAAANAIGLKSRQALTRFAELDTDVSRAFKLELRTARLRRRQIQDHTAPPAPKPVPPKPVAPKPVAPKPAAVVVVAPPPEPPGPPARVPMTRDEYLLQLEDQAQDDECPAQSTAVRCLFSWFCEAPIVAKRLLAEREAKDTGDGGTVVRYAVALPEPDSGPGEDHEPDVIDAEIVEGE